MLIFNQANDTKTFLKQKLLKQKQFFLLINKLLVFKTAPKVATVLVHNADIYFQNYNLYKNIPICHNCSCSSCRYLFLKLQSVPKHPNLSQLFLFIMQILNYNLYQNIPIYRNCSCSSCRYLFPNYNLNQNIPICRNCSCSACRYLFPKLQSVPKKPNLSQLFLFIMQILIFKTTIRTKT